MKSHFKSLATLALAGALAGMMTLGAAVASAAETLRFTWTDPDDPTTVATAAEMHVFKSTFERLTGGRYIVELYPNGQLGDQRSMIQQVRRGTIHAANIASGVLASLYTPKLGIVDLPFVFKSRAHLRAALSSDNPFIHQLLDEVAKDSGIRILSLNPYGFRSLTTRDTVVQKPADVAGLKIRTMEVVPHQEMMKSFGATPVPIPYLELYTSLQTGVVDGEENTPSNIIQQRFYQVQKNLTLTQHLMTVGAVITNEKWFLSLPPEDRKAFIDAEKEARLAHDGIGAVQDLLALGKLKELGMSIYAPTPDEMAAFRRTAEGPARSWAATQWGKEFVDAFYTTIEAADR
ncbi:TRAP transporter substrate-binding protein [Azospirillum sp. B506]|uniref:TRAP transporter substrate-binding protein n=1 Tax=Azospirillum sp. B506 TaxID=137721 RepID=UPI00034D3BBA|nr:TRAP transporter substrate-binding protein [Azospirillum sp. B506]